MCADYEQVHGLVGSSNESTVALVYGAAGR